MGGKKKKHQRKDLPPPPPVPPPRQSVVEFIGPRTLMYIFLGFFLGLAAWGYSVLESPDPNVLHGRIIVFVACVCLVLAFWEIIGWSLTRKALLALLFLVGAGIGVYRWGEVVGRPSFAYVVPGGVANITSWLFMMGHKGPKGNHPVEVLFADEDARRAVLKNLTTLTQQDMDKYQLMLKFDEVNPFGNGHLFAQQFLWKPQNFDHEHFTVEITDSERTTHEDLQIEHSSDDKWFYAIEVIDRNAKKVLLSCKDPGFPYGPPRKMKCFPDATMSSD